VVPVPHYPPSIDSTTSPVVAVLLGLMVAAAVVLVVLALGASRWAGRGRRTVRAVFVGSLVVMVVGAAGAFVADHVTKPGLEQARRDRADEQDRLRTQAADALGAAYGVTIDPVELMYPYTGSPVRVTLPNGDGVACTLGADGSLTLTCPTPLPRDPASADG
jgi:hypothetical protein